MSHASCLFALVAVALVALAGLLPRSGAQSIALYYDTLRFLPANPPQYGLASPVYSIYFLSSPVANDPYPMLVVTTQAPAFTVALYRCNLARECLFVDISAGQGQSSGKDPVAVIDTLNSKLLVSATNGANGDRVSLYRCNYDGSNSVHRDISADQGPNSGLRSFPVIDTVNAKLLVFAVNAVTAPSLFRCQLDGTGCVHVDVSAGQGANCAITLRPLVDVVNAKLLIVVWNNAFSNRPGLFRCELDGTACAYVDISAGQAALSGVEPAAVIDYVNSKLLVVTNNQAVSANPFLFRCNLDGTACTATDLAAVTGQLSCGWRAQVAIDSINMKLTVLTQHYGNAYRPALFRCNLDGTACTYSDVSLGQVLGPGDFPHMLLGLSSDPTALFYVMTMTEEETFILGRCQTWSGTGCTLERVVLVDGPSGIAGERPSIAFDPTTGLVGLAVANYLTKQLVVFVCQANALTLCISVDVPPTVAVPNSGRDARVLIDATASKLLVVARDPANLLSLLRCDLSTGTSCVSVVISAGQASGCAMTPSAVIDVANAKLLVVTENAALGNIPSLFRCNLDGSACVHVDISAGQASNCAKTPSAVVDAANAKLVVVTRNEAVYVTSTYGFLVTASMFRCDLDGSGCVHVDISAGQPSDFLANPAAAIDATNAKLLVVMTNLLLGSSCSLIRCELDGSNCAHTSLSAEAQSGLNPSVLVDAVRSQLLVVAASQGLRLRLLQCALDGTACRAANLSAGLGVGAGALPSPVLASGDKLIVATQNRALPFSPAGLFAYGPAPAENWPPTLVCTAGCVLGSAGGRTVLRARLDLAPGQLLLRGPSLTEPFWSVSVRFEAIGESFNLTDLTNPAVQQIVQLRLVSVAANSSVQGARANFDVTGSYELELSLELGNVPGFRETTSRAFFSYVTVTLHNRAPGLNELSLLARGEVATDLAVDRNCSIVGRVLQADGRCVPCPVGAFCPGGVRMWPLIGFWSFDEFTAPGACALNEACPGAIGQLADYPARTAQPDQLAESLAGSRDTRRCADLLGYDGAFCSTCLKGFYNDQGVCQSCSTHAASRDGQLSALLVVAAVLLLLVLLGVATQTPKHLTVCVSAIIVLQQFVYVGRVAARRLSGEAGRNAMRVFRSASILVFDVEFFQPACLLPTTQSDGLFAMLFWGTLLMLALSLILFAPAALVYATCGYRLRRRSERASSSSFSSLTSASQLTERSGESLSLDELGSNSSATSAAEQAASRSAGSSEGEPLASIGGTSEGAATSDVLAGSSRAEAGSEVASFQSTATVDTRRASDRSSLPATGEHSPSRSALSAASYAESTAASQLDEEQNELASSDVVDPSFKDEQAGSAALPTNLTVQLGSSVAARFFQRMLLATLLLFSFAHFMLCLRTLQGVACEHIALGRAPFFAVQNSTQLPPNNKAELRMRVDLSTRCYVDGHLSTAYVLWPILFVVSFYPLALLGMLLRTRKLSLNGAVVFAHSVQFVTRSLQPHMFWYRLLNFPLNLALAIQLTLVQSFAVRLLLASLPPLANSLLVAWAWPFKSAWQNMLQLVAGLASLIQLAVMLSLPGTSDFHTSRRQTDHVRNAVYAFLAIGVLAVVATVLIRVRRSRAGK